MRYGINPCQEVKLQIRKNSEIIFKGLKKKNLQGQFLLNGVHFYIVNMHWFIKLIIILTFIASLLLSITHGLPKLLPEKVVENGEIKGLIFTDQVWRGEIKITGDVIAMPGSTITITPGTTILVSPKGDNNNFDYLPWHLRSGINTSTAYHGVNPSEPYWDESEKIQIHFGKLMAIGTKELPISIKSDTSYPSPYDFNIISVNDGVLAFASLSNYRRFEINSRFSVRDTVFSQIGECSLCLFSGTQTVVNNTFYDSFRESVWIDGGSPRITDNLFLNRKGSGVIVDPRKRGTPLISHNTFEMPEQDSLVVLSGDERRPGMVTFNIFAGNSTIKLPCDSKLRFSENNLLSVVTFIGSGCGGKFSFGTNYWGTMDSRAILNERITNKDRNFEIVIPSMLTSPPAEAGRR